MFPKIDFAFSGAIKGATIENVVEVETGKTIGCRDVAAAELVKNLESGKWAFSFNDAWDNADSTSVETDAYSDNDAD